MNNIFILSSSFITNTFLYMLDYVLDCNISYVKLLKENHSVDEFGIIAGCKFILCNDVTDGFKSNIVILENNKIPVSTIEKINKQVNPTQIFKFQSPWGNKNNLNDIQEVESIQYGKTPTILNISIGEISQQYCTEVLLNKIFSDKKINFVQEYSPKTAFIFNQMMNKGLLNHKLGIHLNTKNKVDYSLFIKSVEFKDMNEFVVNIPNLNNYSPDFIVFNVDRRFDKLKDIAELIFYKFGCEIFVIHSNYIEVQRTATDKIYTLVSQDHNCDGINLINQINLESKLEERIFSNLGYPQNIYALY